MNKITNRVFIIIFLNGFTLALCFQIREKKAEAAAKTANQIPSVASSAGPSENSTPVASPIPYINCDETSLSESEIPAKKCKTEQEEVQVLPPPLNEQILIDKTASWVCKQSMKSENDKIVEGKIDLLKNSNKERFEFLYPHSKYHNYYKFKLALYTEMLSSDQKEEKTTMIEQEKSNETTVNESDRDRTIVTSNDKSKVPKAKTFPSLKGFFNA